LYWASITQQKKYRPLIVREVGSKDYGSLELHKEVAKVARWCQSLEFSITARLPPLACEEHVVLTVKINDADL